MTDPTKLVKSQGDIPSWEASLAYQELLGFITAVSNAVKGKRVSDLGDSASAGCSALNSLLRTLDGWVDEIPPAEQPARFGNKAYKDWHRRLCQESRGLLRSLVTESLSEEQRRHEAQLACYLEDSFGNATRIDYGTGHELAFVAFACCLFKVGFLVTADCAAVGLSVFPAYLRLVRRLQVTYRMEPAGSHGVWCLDDFQFVPFIWGSAQLIGQAELQPADMPDRAKAERLADEYLLFGCIHYIYQVKSGPFEEHSSTLYGITAVHTWEKVHSGLIKMYKAEILAKFPIIQHFYFGELLPMKAASEFQRPL